VAKHVPKPCKTVVTSLAALGKALGISERRAATLRAAGMPGEPGRYLVEDCRAWMDANVLEPTGNHKPRQAPKNPDGVYDPDLDAAVTGDSPWLEEYRKWNAEYRRIQVFEKQGLLLPRDKTRDALGEIASLIRGTVEAMRRVHGDGPADLLIKSLDRVEQRIGILCGDCGDGDGIASEGSQQGAPG